MCIKIKNVIPVVSDVTTPEVVRYICKYLDPETVVESEKLTAGAPCRWRMSTTKPWLRQAW